MNRLDRHRLANKYRKGLDALSGDSDTTQMATGGVAELLKSIGTMASASQKKKEIDAANQAVADAKANQARVNADPKATADAKSKAQSALDAANAKVAALTGVSVPASSSPDASKGGGKGGKEGSSIFSVTNVAIGVGAILALAVGYKLIKGRSEAPAKGRR